MERRFILVIAILAFVLFWPFFNEPAQGDASVYTYIGSAMLKGKLPYRDAWDIKQPALFFQYAAALLLFGNREIGVFVFDWFLAMAAAVTLFFAGKRAAGENVGAIASIAFISIYFHFAHAGAFGQPETAGALFFSLLLFLGIADKPFSKSESILLGCIAAGMFWYKIPFLLGLAVVLPRIVKGRDWSCLRLSFLPFFAISAVIVAYFFAMGGISDLWQGAFALPARLTSVAGLSIDSRGREVLNAAKLFAGWFPFPLLFAAFGLFSSAKHRARAVIWLAIGAAVAGIWWQGRFLVYHWLVLFPAIALAAGVAGGELTEWMSKYVKARVLVYVAVAIAFFIPSFAQVGLFWGNYLRARGERNAFWSQFSSNYGEGDNVVTADKLPALAAKLAAQTRRGDTILGFDMEPELNFYGARSAPSRFFYLWPLQMEGFVEDAWISEFADSIIAQRPVFIVVPRYNQRTGSDDLQTLLSWAKLGDFFAKNYSLVDRIGALEVYKLR